jgi:RHH-type proline utilization regulon transcriptional repressor/proline dehydrogenase/delta 1-pyrroline-5-carboxylate dehydrogenase
VSEAVDLARYYAGPGIAPLADLVAAGAHVVGRGVAVVVSPWNFPYAIPAGGVLAALAAGDAVVLKPAPEARRCGWFLARRLWAAGVPPDLVQYLACEDGPVGRHLVTHPDVATVVLTGAYETAAMFLAWDPAMHLLAETSGKNALVVTGGADVDLAVKDLVRSAFGHAGQKCSAASLAILTADVYDDGTFLRRLAEAVRSIRVGEATDPDTTMGPLIAPARGALARALTTLDAGESWLVEPRRLDDEGRRWSPGVRLGVRPGSWFHRTECFGPVLGVMRARDLDEALAWQNGTGFGLTGGLHALDPEEIRRWLAGVEVGNAYVNRHTTGAVVQRQPFGGWKRSSVGGSAKAGGPGYVLQLARVTPPAGPVPAGHEVEACGRRWRRPSTRAACVPSATCCATCR